MRLIIRTDGTPERTSVYLNDREVDALGVSINIVGGQAPRALVHLPAGTKEFSEFSILPPVGRDVDLGFA